MLPVIIVNKIFVNLIIVIFEDIVSIYNVYIYVYIHTYLFIYYFYSKDFTGVQARLYMTGFWWCFNDIACI